MYKYLLFDVDDTLLDFHAAEDSALQLMFDQLQLTMTPTIKQRYELINQGLWQQFERKEIDRETIFANRFPQLFREFSLADETISAQAEQLFRAGLNQGHEKIPYAQELLSQLQAAQKFELYIVSNGVAKTQQLRLTASGLAPYFNDVFVSEALGFQKPAIQFFEKVEVAIDHFEPEQALIIGDSLTSDIQGGINAGIKTVWFNPQHQVAKAIQPTYEIDSLPQLLQVVQ